jgi:hypothetical protein
MSEQKLQQWGEWCSPMFAIHNADSALNRELGAYFLDLESQGDKYRKPDKTPSNQFEIFESDFDLFRWEEPCVQKLRDFCLNGLWRVVARMNRYSEDDIRGMRVFVDAWFHVTRFGGYISYHSHPMASWSGVYMVDPGEPGKGGILNFKDPRPHANMYMDQGNSAWQHPVQLGSRNFPMQPGDLLLFPSFLQHEVRPYMGEQPRITVAFNCKFRKA